MSVCVGKMATGGLCALRIGCYESSYQPPDRFFRAAQITHIIVKSLLNITDWKEKPLLCVTLTLKEGGQPTSRWEVTSFGLLQLKLKEFQRYLLIAVVALF